MELPNVSGVLAMLYTDRVAVYRYQGTTDDDGAIISILATKPVLEDIPCRVSLGAKDSPDSHGDKNFTEQRPTLFCGLETPLSRGDFVVVTRKDRELCSGRIGRPNLYGSGQQAQLFFEENA